jgi:hypothetical protein
MYQNRQINKTPRGHGPEKWSLELHSIVRAKHGFCLGFANRRNVRSKKEF